MELEEIEFSSRFANRELAVQWLEWLQTARNRTPNTLRAYAQVVESWCDWLGDDDLRQASASTMEAFTLRRRERGRRRDGMGEPATRKKEVAILRSFYSWLAAMGYIDRSPAELLVGPTVHNVNPRPVPDEWWPALWAQVESPRMKAWVGLGYYGGLRRAELAGLAGCQVTENNLRDFRRKGGGEHTLPWRMMCEVIESRLPHLWMPDFPSSLRSAASAAADGPLIPYLGDHQNLNKQLDRWARRADIGHLTPHMLRHSTATNLLRAGVPLHLVSSLMNHSSVQVTMRYVQAGGNQLREWMRDNL